MLGRGNISQPEKSSGLATFYPERWLSSGQPYEFTTRPTSTPPASLIEAFDRLTSHVGVLGLYHIDKEDKSSKMIEHTEGRRNILMPYTDADRAHEDTQTLTAWDLSCWDPVTMTCNEVIVCDSRTTRSGATHKGIYRNSQTPGATSLLIQSKERSLPSTQRLDMSRADNRRRTRCLVG